MSRKAMRPPPATAPVAELRLDELLSILERAKTAPLSEGEYHQLRAAVETAARLTRALEARDASIDQMRAMFFGESSEKTSRVLGQTGERPRKGKQPGHGRNGADAYPGAKRVHVPHTTLRRGQRCPKCRKGKVYPLNHPAPLVRVTGAAPLAATIHDRDQMRCNLCGEVFTAELPAGVGEDKYDATASNMIALLKYGTGLPFNRLEKLERNAGIPLPATTQWELVRDTAEKDEPVHEELVRQAAQGTVLHNDDTGAKILELSGETRQEALAGGKQDERTGVHTSGIVSVTADGHRIALFITGRQHAGENLADVLKKRAAELSAPIQMCDALAANTAKDLGLNTHRANCNSHARRKFVEVADKFPAECRRVLETLREVYKHDAIARQEKMSPTKRLRLHQAKSGPLMKELKEWMEQELEERRVEPNSRLGDAFGYMLKHWTKLTLFLRKAGAPLDNNICERALKKAILHRKNALFYKTLNGAHVGDLFLSFIHTAELNGVEAFDYLVALERHHDEAAAHPAAWMPWNYQATLEASPKQ